MPLSELKALIYDCMEAEVRPMQEQLPRTTK
ncbi:hypothetical protein AN393_03732 [Pseudoalteromonas sp. P1-25]|nr:hypothetical protein AN393_03732 [Pseudoalteromonas sp. P1-25]